MHILVLPVSYKITTGKEWKQCCTYYNSSKCLLDMGTPSLMVEYRAGEMYGMSVMRGLHTQQTKALAPPTTRELFYFA